MTESKEIMIQKGLSEWWSEETEYVLQRIEKWTTFISGYNLLRSQSLKWSKWKSCPEETKINCCSTFNYQSNSKLESNCLETYRYDHSIYFKTIGDIRSNKRDVNRDLEQDRMSTISEELVEWDASSVVDLTAKPISEEICNNNRPDELNISDTIAEQEKNGTMQNTWPIVDLSKLDLDLMDNRKKKRTASLSG
ncbi:hypothetical protein EAG_07376 [Camponotus floridanus]|uniref:Uncharacterized protein n=1 Tax=Camponotus floridanus TaxID=104421 RepID=E2AFI5_CAMFO|nr:hypothetical protein EAG_07376 [Camponotus floridanus]